VHSRRVNFLIIEGRFFAKVVFLKWRHQVLKQGRWHPVTRNSPWKVLPLQYDFTFQAGSCTLEQCVFTGVLSRSPSRTFPPAYLSSTLLGPLLFQTRGRSQRWSLLAILTSFHPRWLFYMIDKTRPFVSFFAEQKVLSSQQADVSGCPWPKKIWRGRPLSILLRSFTFVSYSALWPRPDP